MDDDIFHLGIVDRALRRAAPGFFGRFIVGKQSDDVERIEFGEFERLGIAHATAEHQVQLAHVKFLGEGFRGRA